MYGRGRLKRDEFSNSSVIFGGSKESHIVTLSRIKNFYGGPEGKSTGVYAIAIEGHVLILAGTGGRHLVIVWPAMGPFFMGCNGQEIHDPGRSYSRGFTRSPIMSWG